MESNKKYTSSKRTKKAVDLPFNPLNVGLLPPQAPDLEEAVLGAIMLEKEAIHLVIELLQPQTFYVDAHCRIYDAILDLYKDKHAIDILTVTNKLKSKGELEIVGGAYYVSKLTNRVGSSANIEFHARIIVQKFMARELIRVATLAIKMAFDDMSDIIETIDMVEGEIMAMNMTASQGKKVTTFKDHWHEMRERNIKLQSSGGLSGIPTCHAELDLLTAGWQKTDLIVLAARPGMGKTAFVLGVAKNAALKHKKRIAIFSLEMAAVQLCTRMTSDEKEVSIRNLTIDGLPPKQWNELEKGVNDLMEAPLFIDDTSGLNIVSLRSKLRRLVKEQGVEMAIIDYLQLMEAPPHESGKFANREATVSSISRGLKILAKELEIPIIVLSQLNRQVETRAGGNKRPQLSDLRESGAIEQDADIVMFIHRPEYYGEMQYANGESTVGIGEIILSKFRNGAPNNTVKLKYLGQYTKFVDIQSEYTPKALPINTIDFTEPRKDGDEDLF